MSNKHTGIDKASLNIFRFKPWVAFEDRFKAVARGKHPKDVFNGKPPPSYNRFPTEYPGVHRDPF